MPQLIDCYRILQVEPTASKTEVTAAYRRLCKIYHPDINHEVGAEALMKNLNAAYHILRDDGRRRDYDIKRGFAAGFAVRGTAFNATHRPHTPPPAWEPPPRERAPDPPRGESQSGEQSSTPEAAVRTMKAYMDHLLAGEHEKAYQLLCLHDRQYVTLQSFCKWRESVQKLFVIREYEIRHSEAVDRFQMDEGTFAQARKLYINITEKNVTQGTVDKYQFNKHTVLEYGKWRVFLGYRDLNEIAKMFEDLSRRQEEGEMAKRWEEYCRNTCRGLDMLSREGLLKEARRELYRCRRYGQSMTVALFNVRPYGQKVSEEALGDVVEICARTLTRTLRETDIPAYIGEGMFVVLFVEMRRKNAQGILQRMAIRLKQQVLQESGRTIAPRFAFELYEGGDLNKYIDDLPGKIVR